jgi:DNA repair photolyase
MKRWGEQKPIHLDEREMKTDLGSGNFIFVGSSCDMFARDVPDEWIESIFDKIFDNEIKSFSKRNKYLLQTRNIKRIPKIAELWGNTFTICTTIESNRMYEVGNAPSIQERIDELKKIKCVPKMITIEPIMDFDIYPLLGAIKELGVIQVNIGADSGNNGLPEPPKEKVLELIAELEKFTRVVQKKNLGRLMK